MSGSSSSSSSATIPNFTKKSDLPHLHPIPRYVQYTSPVSLAPAETPGQTGATTLPLNLIALIISYLDDIGDIARVTRTSRLLYYMTLPQLYQKVNLHSYPDIRYVQGRPEGFGSGSPFTMALNGLVTKSHANLVKEFRVFGFWRELGVEDFSKGRVPDNNMMLNIILRAATDKMTKLHKFAWELDCKPLKTLYQGLATHDTLTALTLKFSSSRQPRPSVVVPPMANLRTFWAMDIDPLCYPDDISIMLLHSKKLSDLRLHFSPRMRAEAESSLSMETYFGQCFKAGYEIPLKHFGMQNWYGTNSAGLDQAFDTRTCKKTTFFDVFGGAKGSSKNVFLDETWKNIPRNFKTNFRSCRTNEFASQHIDMIASSSGMEKMYFVSAVAPKSGWTPDDADAKTPVTPEPPSYSVAALGSDYIRALTRSHGETLRHLLLSDQWSVTPDEVGEVVRYCPNLQQLGLALSDSNHMVLRILIPFLTKLGAFRVLHNDFLADHLRTVSHQERMDEMSHDMGKQNARSMKWIGLGNIVYRCGRFHEVQLEDGRVECRREITMASMDDVRHLEIWSMDNLDLFQEPPAT